MSVELERRGLPTAMISALPPVAMELGANRVVRGVKIRIPAATRPPIRRWTAGRGCGSLEARSSAIAGGRAADDLRAD